MIFIGNVFIFFGFFFLLLIYRRKFENIFALERYSEDEAEEQSSPDVKPIPKVWFILELICFLLGVFLRYVAAP